MSDCLTISKLFLGLLLTIPHSLAAGPSSYVCRITDYKSPKPDTSGDDYMAKLAMEDTVAIDRKTGRVIHPIIGNTSFTNVILLNEGSADWSFKALADSGGGGHVRYYEVQEYNENPVKPFIAVVDGLAYFGECD